MEATDTDEDEDDLHADAAAAAPNPDGVFKAAVDRLKAAATLDARCGHALFRGAAHFRSGAFFFLSLSGTFCTIFWSWIAFVTRGARPPRYKKSGDKLDEAAAAALLAQLIKLYAAAEVDLAQAVRPASSVPAEDSDGGDATACGGAGRQRLAEASGAVGAGGMRHSPRAGPPPPTHTR